MRKLNLAVVGLGSIAEYHLRSFQKLPGANLRAVMSRNSNSMERVKNTYHVEKSFQDYGQLLGEKEVDALVLCTPNDLHFEMAKAALEAGKHVLVEKPLAGTLAEAKTLCQLAKKNKRTLMVAMTARFTPQYLSAFHILRKGEIGEIIQILIRWLETKTIGINWEKKPVPVDKRTSTVLYHHGSHMLDAALWFINEEPDIVRAVGSRRQVLNDDVAILVKTKKGKLISSVHSFNSPRKFHDLLVIGANGLLEINSYEKLFLNGDLKVQTTWQEGLNKGVDNQAVEFLESILEDRPPIAGGREVLASFKVLEKAYTQLERQGLC